MAIDKGSSVLWAEMLVSWTGVWQGEDRQTDLGLAFTGAPVRPAEQVGILLSETFCPLQVATPLLWPHRAPWQWKKLIAREGGHCGRQVAAVHTSAAMGD